MSTDSQTIVSFSLTQMGNHSELWGEIRYQEVTYFGSRNTSQWFVVQPDRNNYMIPITDMNLLDKLKTLLERQVAIAARDSISQMAIDNNEVGA